MNNPNVQPVNGSGNLRETVGANASFKTFAKAIDQAGYSEKLSGPGTYTVFAPTDAAFAKLPAGEMDKLMKPENKPALVAMLDSHIVEGRRSAADLREWDSAKGKLESKPRPNTLKGEPLAIDPARITSADIASSNGVIHGIDSLTLSTVTRQ